MPDDALTELAAGNYGDLSAAFVFIARDVETYAALRHMLTTLPDKGADFFKTHAVVAAFLGRRRTGGYHIEIKQTGRQNLNVIAHAPGKGAMVKMALTAPFRVVAVPLEMNDALNLTLDEVWQQNLRPYKLTDGALLISGGFAGRSDSARLEGSLRVMRAGELATFLFDVRSVGGKRAAHMFDAATGTVATDGRVRLTRLDSFALSGATESSLRVEGEFTDGEQKLSLRFETVPAPHIADNFNARGSLKATATAPAPAHKAVAGDPF